MDWNKLKDEGNALLKDSNLGGAIEKYSKALELCGDSDKEGKQILLSNRSAAYLKAGDLQNALADSISCIEVNPAWAKAYSRKSAVLREMKQFKEASEVAQEGLKLEASNIALKTLYRACETSLVCNKLRGVWHGKVAEEVGGYMQVFDFWSDTDVRVAVLGTTVDAKYELDVFGSPFPHLDMSVPNSPGAAFVRHIYRFASDDELQLCSPYMRPPEERPTEFKGAGMVTMKRGAFELSAEEKKEREALLSMPLNERVLQFLEQSIAAVPSFNVRPKEGEDELLIGEKLTANVKFQTFYQGLVEKLGTDAELVVKELVVGIRNLANETERIVKLVQSFQEKMKQAGLISDEDGSEESGNATQNAGSQDTSTNAIVGTAPPEVLASAEARAKFISGADEPLAPIDTNLLPPPSEEVEARKPRVKVSKTTPANTGTESTPAVDRATAVAVGTAVVVAVIAIGAALWFNGRDDR